MASRTTDGMPAKATGYAAAKRSQDATLTVKAILLETLKPGTGILLSLGVVQTRGRILLVLGGVLLVLLLWGVLTVRLLLIV